MRSKLDLTGSDTEGLQAAEAELRETKKQLSISTAKLDTSTRELSKTKHALDKSQERVATLTAAVAAAEEAASEKWQQRAEALHVAHRTQHAAATQAWHEHSTARLDDLKRHLEEQFAAQSFELQQRCERLQSTNAHLEETNTETLQAAEQAAELANDLMAQLSESERARSTEQTTSNAQVLTLKQAVRNAEREQEATSDENRTLQQQLTKLNAQIDQYASLLEAEEEHHSIGDRPAAGVRLLAPAHTPPPQVRQTLLGVPTNPAQLQGVVGSVPVPHPPSSEKPALAARKSPPRQLHVSLGYGGLGANYGLAGVSPVSPRY